MKSLGNRKRNWNLPIFLRLILFFPTFYSQVMFLLMKKVSKWRAIARNNFETKIDATFAKRILFEDTVEGKPFLTVLSFAFFRRRKVVDTDPKYVQITGKNCQKLLKFLLTAQRLQLDDEYPCSSTFLSDVVRPWSYAESCECICLLQNTLSVCLIPPPFCTDFPYIDFFWKVSYNYNILACKRSATRDFWAEVLQRLIESWIFLRTRPVWKHFSPQEISHLRENLLQKKIA